jgi:hypothetical protein
MIYKIKNTKALQPFITDRCEENKIAAEMDEEIRPENYLVLKVDDYYKLLHLADTPPSLDCLVPLKCSDNTFIIHLIELKKIKKPGGFSVDNIYKKFKTTIENFMTRRFKNIFHNEKYYAIKRLELYFVTSPYGNDEKIRRKEGTTRMDALLARPPFRFMGKKYQIKHKLPNPIIKSC